MFPFYLLCANHMLYGSCLRRKTAEPKGNKVSGSWLGHGLLSTPDIGGTGKGLIVRWIVAWILYGFGDAVARLDRLWCWWPSFYPLYCRLMVWSAAVQGPSGNGPWSEARQ